MRAVSTLTAVAVIGATAGLSAGPGAAAAPEPPDRPPVQMAVAADEVHVHKSGDRVYLDFGAFLVAGNDDFQVLTTRSSWYTEPESMINVGDEVNELPDELGGFGVLRGFVRITMRDADNRLVLDRTRDYCLNRGGVRARPNAPDTSVWPYGCSSYMPWMVGQIQGITRGWGVPMGGGAVKGLELGTYTAKVSVTAPWRREIGIRESAAAETVTVHVERDNCRDCRSDDRAAPERTLQPRATEPRGPGMAPPPGTPLPDMRSLPSWQINLSGNDKYLRFAANVWNAGPSNLVVDGFRDHPNQDLMRAVQYFYAADGTPSGHARVGTMQWDDRDGHTHWHFTDFARYRLVRMVDGDPVNVFRSKKQAFCLAATDAIDMTLPGADFRPYNTDLHTACGDYSSLGVREVLQVGHGDTYGQYLPGQAFRVDNISDGIYFVEVTANPDAGEPGSLYESDYSNNSAYRKIKLDTEQNGDRTVKVFAKGLIDHN